MKKRNLLPKSNLESPSIILFSGLLLIVSIYAAIHTKIVYFSSIELNLIKALVIGIIGLLVFLVPSLFFMLWTRWHILIRTLLSAAVCIFFYFMTPNTPADPTIKLSLTSSNPIIDFRTSLAPLQDVKNASVAQLKESIKARNDARSVIILSLQYVSTVEDTRRATVQNEELTILFEDGELKYYGSYIVNVTNNSRWLESKEDLVARKIGSDSILESEVLFYPVDKKTTWAQLKQRLDEYPKEILLIKVQSDINGRKESFSCEVDMRDYKLRFFKDGLWPYPPNTIQPACS